MQKKKILVADRFSQEGLSLLSSQPFLEIEKGFSKDQLAFCNGLLIRSGQKVDRDLLKSSKNLEVIVTTTSGFDHIDLQACSEWGITVMHTPDAHIDSAAQTTWALLLACCQRILEAHQQVKASAWRRDLLAATELSGKTYGIIGLGRIGKKVSEYARAFGMKVVAYDPYLEDQVFRDYEADRISLEELLMTADVISLHVPKTKETKHLINHSNLDYINRDAILINTSRGSAIEEMALINCLEKGWPKACGLDVFEREPLDKTSRLLSFSNLVLTPHIGALTTEAFQKASEQGALKVIRFFMDGSTSDTLPPKAPWYSATI